MRPRLLLLLALALLVACDLPAPPVGDPTQIIGLPPSATSAPATAAPAATTTATSLPPSPTTLAATPGAPAPVYGYRVLKTYPHDPTAFTEGLILENGMLYEGTGLNGQSELRQEDLASGEVQMARSLPEDEFGEGITLVGDRVIQLTWQSNIGYVYDRSNFMPLRTFNYSGEGWGLTYDGTRLIMSDGTATLRMLDPNTFAEVGRVAVSDENGPVTQLNELEYVKGVIYANVWHSERIARIDPASGRVTAWLDLTGVAGADRPSDSEAVLNGIAYDAAQDKLIVTGKLWPHMYEIEIVGGN